MSIQKLVWSSFKSLKDNNSSETILYYVEKEYKSNDPSVSDIDRYFVKLTVGNVDYFCFVPKVASPESGSDQEDWEDNYKSGAISL